MNKIKLSKPNSCTTEVLYALIQDGRVSIEQFYWMCGFRTRISELKKEHGLMLNSETLTGCNKHGREYKYTNHFIAPENILTAVVLYNKINTK